MFQINFSIMDADFGENDQRVSICACAMLLKGLGLLFGLLLVLVVG